MHKQNQRSYASRWANIKEIMHRDGQNQRNYASSSENINKKIHACGVVGMFKQKWGEYV